MNARTQPPPWLEQVAKEAWTQGYQKGVDTITALVAEPALIKLERARTALGWLEAAFENVDARALEHARCALREALA